MTLGQYGSSIKFHWSIDYTSFKRCKHIWSHKKFIHMYCETGPWMKYNRHVHIANRISTHVWSLQWRHNGRDGASNHPPYHRLLNRLFRHRWKITPKPRVTGLCVGNLPVTGELPTQMASNAEDVSIWWRHHVMRPLSQKCILLYGLKSEMKLNKVIYFNQCPDNNTNTGVILGLRPANERRRYFVTTSLIGWPQA